jgi:hypothetical protein
LGFLSLVVFTLGKLATVGFLLYFTINSQSMK